MKFLSTGQLADLLGVPVHRLDYLTRDHQIRPKKGPTGAFFWTYEDARQAATLLNEPPPTQSEFCRAMTTVSSVHPLHAMKKEDR